MQNKKTDMTNSLDSDLKDRHYTFYKEYKKSKVWRVNTIDKFFGEHLFSFDKKKIYNLFADYPHNMTEEEIKILDEEEPELTGLLQFRKEIKDFKTR